MADINTEKAYEYIREKILRGKFPVGSALRTETVAEEVGVSRTPVRDAFRMLESDGLITIQPRLGARVKKVNLAEYREICELRVALESHAAGLAAKNRSEYHLDEIKWAYESMKKLVDTLSKAEEDYEQLVENIVEEDIRFHIAIITAARNQLIKKEILRLHLINRVVSVPLSIRNPWDTNILRKRNHSVLEAHKEIYEAIAAASPEKAKYAMEKHLEDMISFTISKFHSDSDRSDMKELTDEERIYQP